MAIDKSTIQCFIYKITSPTGRIYIGQTNNLKRRQSRYNNIRTEDRQPLIHNSIKKYGWGNHTFEKIEECNGISVGEREIYWIDFYKSNYSRYPEYKGMNLTDGGEGSRGHKMTQETSDKLRKANLGRKLTEAHKQKLSLAKQNMTEETRRKIGIASKGRKASQETRAKMSKAKKGVLLGKRKVEIRGKEVLDLNAGIYYISLAEYARAAGVKLGTIHDQLKKKRRIDIIYV